jgi:sugar phosphate permease
MGIGVPVLAPAIRDAYDLSLGQIGVVLAAEWVGTLVTLVPWGLAADRFGERVVLGVGLGSGGVLLAAAGHAPGFFSLVALLALAGALGASVISASGRAVMQWFGPHERGLALGIRQSAIPLGGLVAAVVLPFLDLEGAFLFLGGICVAAAVVGVLVLRSAEVAEESIEPEAVEWSIRDARLWRLSCASSLYLVAQVALIGFVVLFLHDERGFSPGRAAAVLAAMQVLAVGLRIAVGRWSDGLGSRVGPLRLVGVAVAVSLVASTALLSASRLVLVPVLVVVGALSMAWNGLAFTAAAELAGRARSGAAIGVQQTVLSAVGVVAPIAFAAAVSATSWRAAYALAALAPLVGWRLLAPLARA